MAYRILAVNPGSTSTKIAVYENETQIFTETIVHQEDVLSAFEKITDQYDYRRGFLMETLQRRGISVESLHCVVGRGGLLPPIKTGGYVVNEDMKSFLRSGQIQPHASSLGALLADSIAAPMDIPAYIYDGVTADALQPIAKITGIPEVVRASICHVLNARAMARKAAADHGKAYEDLNFLVAHLGGGFSITAHRKGVMIDVIGDDAGPYSPERSGSVPLKYIVNMCYSGEYTKEQILRKMWGEGGLKALLGTKSCYEVEQRIAAGDTYARSVYEAMAYQVAKGLGEMAPTLKGDIDYVILTGGAANSTMLTDWIREYVSFLAPVLVYAGEDEMEALALGALRILRGEEEAHTFTLT